MQTLPWVLSSGESMEESVFAPSHTSQRKRKRQKKQAQVCTKLTKAFTRELQLTPDN